MFRFYFHQAKQCCHEISPTRTAYTAKTPQSADLMQIVNFAGLLQLVNKLVNFSLLKFVICTLVTTCETTCSKPVDNMFEQSTSCRKSCKRILISVCCIANKLLQDVNRPVITCAFFAVLLIIHLTIACHGMDNLRNRLSTYDL